MSEEEKKEKMNEDTIKSKKFRCRTCGIVLPYEDMVRHVEAVWVFNPHLRYVCGAEPVEEEEKADEKSKEKLERASGN
jgi:hypothetical protein